MNNLKLRAGAIATNKDNITISVRLKVRQDSMNDGFMGHALQHSHLDCSFRGRFAASRSASISSPGSSNNHQGTVHFNGVRVTKQKRQSTFCPSETSRSHEPVMNFKFQAGISVLLNAVTHKRTFSHRATVSFEDANIFVDQFLLKRPTR